MGRTLLEGDLERTRHWEDSIRGRTLERTRHWRTLLEGDLERTRHGEDSI